MYKTGISVIPNLYAELVYYLESVYSSNLYN